jgi:hypothetical protein
VPGTLIQQNVEPTATGIVSDAHVYSEVGVFGIVLVARDDFFDGWIGADTALVTVMIAPEALDFNDGAVQNLSEACSKGPGGAVEERPLSKNRGY